MHHKPKGEGASTPYVRIKKKTGNIPCLSCLHLTSGSSSSSSSCIIFRFCMAFLRACRAFSARASFSAATSRAAYFFASSKIPRSSSSGTSFKKVPALGISNFARTLKYRGLSRRIVRSRTSSCVNTIEALSRLEEASTNFVTFRFVREKFGMSALGAAWVSVRSDTMRVFRMSNDSALIPRVKGNGERFN